MSARVCARRRTAMHGSYAAVKRYFTRLFRALAVRNGPAAVLKLGCSSTAIQELRIGHVFEVKSNAVRILLCSAVKLLHTRTAHIDCTLWLHKLTYYNVCNHHYYLTSNQQILKHTASIPQAAAARSKTKTTTWRSHRNCGRYSTKQSWRFYLPFRFRLNILHFMRIVKTNVRNESFWFIVFFFFLVVA